MIKDAIAAAVEGKDLDMAQARAVMSELMSGEATPSQIGAFLTACRMKGETEDELVGFALAMREASASISAPPGAVDLCGTGGDGAGTFNISTVASFIVSACGVPVAKHGNRSVSSKSGSADLLDALGIPYDLDPASVQKCIDTTGFGFMFAPVFHPSMKNVVAPRREVGIRTLFNLLGPLTNPARVSCQLMGVYDGSVATKVAGALSRLGVSRAMVVNGCGMDEISNLGTTHVVEVMDGKMSEYSLSPSDCGLDIADRGSLVADSAGESARITMSILRGEPSPRYDAAVMNAGAALYVSGAAESIQDGIELSGEAVKSGRALEKLSEIVRSTREMEAERQLLMQVSSLRSRRILPEALRARAHELTKSLSDEIALMDGGQSGLDALDGELTSSPNALSVISLSRLRSVLSKGVQESASVGVSQRSFADAISRQGLAVIGEYKPRSPSHDGAYVSPDPLTVAEQYARAGVSAMSVLVEEEFFGGGPDLFSAVHERSTLPLLFKDFVVTEEQLRMAKALGADAVLLIAKALREETLDAFIASSLEKGMEPVVELHDYADIKKFMSCRNAGDVRVVGLNSRDLRTLATDTSKLNKLRCRLPSDKLVIAESGVRDGADVRSLRGFDAVLVGSVLMESDDLPGKAEELVNAGRSVLS